MKDISNQNKKKILVVASSSMGGSGLVAFRLANQFAKLTVETYFLSFDKPHLANDENDISPSLHLIQPKIFDYPLFNFPLKESSLVESIVENVLKYEITEIHCHYSFVYGFAAITAVNLLKSVYNRDIKIILTCHGTDVIGYDPNNIGSEVFKHFNKFVIKLADIVVCASEALKKLIFDIYQINREINIIQNFVDTEKFKPSAKLIRKPNIIVHMSNFRDIKRPLYIIDIFYEVLKKKKEAKLVMIGDGPLFIETQKYAKNLGISQSIRFTGKITIEEEVVKILQTATCLLHPSLFENSSLTCIEALACGVPVVCTNVGGLPELIKDGYNGYLIDANDYEGFADACDRILSDENLRDNLSINAVKTIDDLSLNLDVVAHEYLNLI